MTSLKKERKILRKTQSIVEMPEGPLLKRFQETWLKRCRSEKYCEFDDQNFILFRIYSKQRKMTPKDAKEIFFVGFLITNTLTRMHMQGVSIIL